MAKVSVIGAGSWGTALATVLDHNGHDVTVWSIVPEEIEMLDKKREHESKLPGVKISEKIIFTTDLEQAISGMEMVVLAVPSVYTRSTAKSMAPFISDGQLIVSVAKGIEESTLHVLVDVIKEEIPTADVAVLSGPSHAEEVGRTMPTTCVAGSHSKKTAEKIQDLFMNDYFRVYTSPDVLGLELGGSLKNVIALAAGMADGLGCGDNTKAALITRGIAELSRLGVAMGAAQETLAGLSGMGDLIVTCASKHSRNRRAGMAKAAKALAEKYNVSMPIIEKVCRVLFEGYSPKDALLDLMQRDKRSEHTTLSWNEE
jgi:glycerol-3-phosphate dehydrogenase (NAD(P)+)